MRKFKVGKTIYQRSTKSGVGKEIGGKIYVHKNYVGKVVNENDFNLAKKCLPSNFLFNCIMYDRKNSIIRFDEAPDFDVRREPHPGDFIEVNFTTMEIRKGHSDFIWHHKWMWVMDDYDGFDVNESYEWSKEWTQIITHPSGSKRVWDQQLNKGGLV